VAALRVVGALVVSGEGAREFVAYGGHGVLLRLLASPDSGVVGAVDALLVEAGRAAAQVGLPFPSLHAQGLLGDGEVASGRLWQYNFKGGDGEETAVLVQPVTKAQESQVPPTPYLAPKPTPPFSSLNPCLTSPDLCFLLCCCLRVIFSLRSAT
jgi:hypothetical protein